MFNVERFFYYDELSSEAKAQARNNVIIPEKANRDEMISLWRLNISQAKTNALRLKQGLKLPKNALTIHSLVNNRLHHKRFINGSQAYYKIQQQGDDYLIPYIRQNLCIFTEKGDYVYYISGCVEMISQGEHFMLNSEEVKQTAIQAYIDVNKRGPAYHAELYRNWARVKRNMIVNN